MALGFWYGGRLMTFGEYDAEQFFVIFVAIIFGGQAAGFLFGFTMSKLSDNRPFPTAANSSIPQIQQKHTPPRIKFFISENKLPPSMDQPEYFPPQVMILNSQWNSRM